MDWPTWVAYVFDRIARQWRENKRVMTQGIPLSVDNLVPDLANSYPRDDLFDALVEAYIDLEWLGVVADPDIHDPTMIQATPIGRSAVQSGLMAAVMPHIRAKCNRLSSDELKFLEATVKADQLVRNARSLPRWIWLSIEKVYTQAFALETCTERDVFVATEIAGSLWSQGLLVRQGRESLQVHGYPQMYVAAMSAGFACVRARDNSA